MAKAKQFKKTTKISFKTLNKYVFITMVLYKTTVDSDVIANPPTV